MSLKIDPRLIPRQLGEYVPAEWDGKNESGIDPWFSRVLVLPDSCAPTTSGGIGLTDDMVERHTMAAETGVLVAMGPEAFAKYRGEKPKCGRRVVFDRYAGTIQHGADGRYYRIMEDESLGAGFADGMVPVKKRTQQDLSPPNGRVAQVRTSLLVPR